MHPLCIVPYMHAWVGNGDEVDCETLRGATACGYVSSRLFAAFPARGTQDGSVCVVRDRGALGAVCMQTTNFQHFREEQQVRSSKQSRGTEEAECTVWGTGSSSVTVGKEGGGRESQGSGRV